MPRWRWRWRRSFEVRRLAYPPRLPRLGWPTALLIAAAAVGIALWAQIGSVGFDTWFGRAVKALVLLVVYALFTLALLRFSFGKWTPRRRGRFLLIWRPTVRTMISTAIPVLIALAVSLVVSIGRVPRGEVPAGRLPDGARVRSVSQDHPPPSAGLPRGELPPSRLPRVGR